MAITIDEIRTELEGRGFPISLIEDGFSSIVNRALNGFNTYSSISTYGSFNTVADQQDYYIFDPDNVTLAGFAQNAADIKNIYWNPGSSEIIGAVGEPGSFLRLSPVPQESDIKVIVEFGNLITLDLLGRTQVENFMEWVCYYVSDSLANVYSTTAGIELLGFTDSTSAMKYWQGKASYYHEQCRSLQGGIHGEVNRT